MVLQNSFWLYLKIPDVLSVIICALNLFLVLLPVYSISFRPVLLFHFLEFTRNFFTILHMLKCIRTKPCLELRVPSRALLLVESVLWEKSLSDHLFHKKYVFYAVNVFEEIALQLQMAQRRLRTCECGTRMLDYLCVEPRMYPSITRKVKQQSYKARYR